MPATPFPLLGMPFHMSYPPHPWSPDLGSPRLLAFPTPARQTNPPSLFSLKVRWAAAVWPPSPWDRERLGRGAHPSQGRTLTPTLTGLAQWFSNFSEPQNHVEGLVKHRYLGSALGVCYPRPSLVWQVCFFFRSQVKCRSTWFPGDLEWWRLHQLSTPPSQHMAQGQRGARRSVCGFFSARSPLARPNHVSHPLPSGWGTRRADEPSGEHPGFSATTTPRFFAGHSHTGLLSAPRTHQTLSSLRAVAPAALAAQTLLCQTSRGRLKCHLPGGAFPDCPKQPPTPWHQPIWVLCVALMMLCVA